VLRRTPFSYGEGLLHGAVMLVLVTEQVTDLVSEHREQVLAVLVARRGELGVLPRGRIDEPTPAGGVVVQPDGAAGGEVPGPGRLGELQPVLLVEARVVGHDRGRLDGRWVPQLAAARAVVGAEVQLVVHADQVGWVRSRAAGPDVLHQDGTGGGAVALPEFP